jgi:hypothetical protein
MASCPLGLVGMDTLPRVFAGACKIVARPCSLDCSGNPAEIAKRLRGIGAPNLKGTTRYYNCVGILVVSQFTTDRYEEENP